MGRSQGWGSAGGGPSGSKNSGKTGESEDNVGDGGWAGDTKVV